MTDQQTNRAGECDFEEASKRSVDAGIADETAASNEAMVPTEGGKSAEDSAAHPS